MASPSSEPAVVAAETRRGRPIAPHDVHPGCFVCGVANPDGLRLLFVEQPDHAVEVDLACDTCLQGYPGRLHGGIIAAALDGAMTHALLLLGRTGVTAELSVRYKQPVCVGSRARVRARLQRDLDPLFVLEAELIQDSAVKATAVGKFIVVDLDDQPPRA